MLDNLAIINNVIEAHRTIRRHIKLVGESVNDLEALSTLQNVYSDWTQSSMEALAESQKKLQQTISFLDEGLKNHFGFEEKALPPLFGELLMRALLFEHQGIRSKLSEAKSMVADVRLEGLKQEELLTKRSHIQQLISDLCQVVEEHATREELILGMIKRALEEEGRNRS